MFIEIAENDWIDPMAVERIRLSTRGPFMEVVEPFIQITLSCGSKINLPREITLESVLETINEAKSVWNNGESFPPLTGDGQG